MTIMSATIVLAIAIAIEIMMTRDLAEAAMTLFLADEKIAILAREDANNF